MEQKQKNNNYKENCKDKLLVDYKKQLERERILRNIIESISCSLEFKSLIKNIVTEIGKYVKADRCVLLRVDETQAKQFPVEDFAEYRANDDVKSMINFDINHPALVKMGELNPVYNTSGVDIINKKLIEELLTYHNMRGTKVEQYLIDYSINTYMGLNIYYLGKIKGILVVHSSATDLNITDDDKQFLLDISKYTALLLNQIDLYEKTKKEVEREKVLRSIVESIRTSLDFRDISKNLVTEVGKYFKADRCFLMQFDQKIMFPREIDEYSEYRSDEKYFSVVGFDFTDPEKTKELRKWDTYIPKPRPGLFMNYPNMKEYLIEHDLVGSDLECFFEFHNMKAICALSIFYKNEMKGSLAIHWDKYDVVIEEQDKAFLKEIVNQAAVALHQADLYREQEEQAKKERLLISVSNEIRRSLDIEEASKSICEKIIEIFDVQEVHLCEFSYDNKSACQELLKLGKNKVRNENLVQFKSIICLFKELFENEKQLNINNWEKNNLPSSIKEYYHQQQIKSVIATRFDIDQNKFGAIILHEYRYQRKWAKNEIELLDSLGEQISFAIKHANTFSGLKQQMEKEKVLKLDQSILVNKNLAINTDLNSAITYSFINNTYNYKKDLNKLTPKGFLEISPDDLQKATCLSESQVLNSIYKLYECELIDYKKDNDKDNIYCIKPEDNKEIKVKYLSLQNNKIASNDQDKDKLIFNDYDELCQVYSENFSKDAIEAVKYYLEKCKQNPATITRFYFSMLCRIFYEFINNHSLSLDRMKSIIDEWLSPNKKVASLKSNTILAKRLKKVFILKLYTSQTLATDMASKIDFSSINITLDENDLED